MFKPFLSGPLLRSMLFATTALSLCYSAHSQEIDSESVLDEPIRLKDMKAVELARVLGVSGDDRRPQDQYRTAIFGRELIIGGEIELAANARQGTALSPDAQDGRAEVSPEVQMELLYDAAPNVAVFVNVQAGVEADIWREGGGKDTESTAELSEAWVLVNNFGAPGMALQIGRQKYQDRREWWWDEELDSVRLHAAFGHFTGFIGIAENLTEYTTADGGLSPEDEKITRVLANAGWIMDKRNRLDAFFLHQNDHSSAFEESDEVLEEEVDESDADLTWLGARWRGRAKLGDAAKIYVQADAAVMSGSETLTRFEEQPDGTFIADDFDEFDVEGWAADVSLSLELPLESEPYLTFAYARGSGDDDPEDGVDKNFRQTGLQGNNGKYRGISRFRYYGEAIRPELSNLQVVTASAGIPLGENAWIETSLRDYRQVEPSEEFRTDRLDASPLGEDAALGHGLDVVFSYERARNWEFELSAGAFRAGAAFGPAEGEWTGSIAMKLDYNF